MESKFKMFCQGAGKQKPPRTGPGGEDAAKLGRGTENGLLGQLPIQRVLVVLQVRAVGQDDVLALGQLSIQRDDDLAADRAALGEVGLVQVGVERDTAVVVALLDDSKAFRWRRRP